MTGILTSRRSRRTGWLVAAAAVSRVRGGASRLLLVGLLLATATTARTDERRAAPISSGFAAVSSVPVVADHLYTMSGRIRPLFFFWINRDDVGSGRITWHRGKDDAVAFELLIGSDPLRAPRGINRWGYIAEQVNGSDATLLGLMTESKEKSLDEAKARVAQEPDERVFVGIRSEVTAGQAASAVIPVRGKQTLTYRDAPDVVAAVEREHERSTPAARVRRIALPPDVRPGFLATVAELVHRSVLGWQSSERAGTMPGGGTLGYVFNGKLYDLRLRQAEWLRDVTFGTRRFTGVLRSEFEIRNWKTGKRTAFELIYGTEGSLAEIPVRIRYRPRWWLEVDLILDEAAQS